MRKQPDLREQANQISHLLNVEFPSSMMQTIKAIGDTIADNLGDSPERWRGAQELIRGIVDPLTDPNIPAKDAKAMISVVLAELSTRPQSVATLEAIWKEATGDR